MKTITMAKQTATVSVKAKKAKKKRPDVHAKKKTSRSKKAKNYKKAYRGQGR